MKLAQGLVGGGIIFVLALFGAILSGPQRFGPISIVLTKLPTENVLASFVLGFLGSFLLGVIFRGADNNKSSKGTNDTKQVAST
jgi:fluoride ion exporter CrcB/FEX